MFETLKYDGKDYNLTLTFDAVRTIEQSTGKSLIRLDSSSITDMTIALSATTEMDIEQSFDAIKDLGIPAIAVAIQSLIINTFNPEKKPEKAAKKQTA